MRFAHISDVHLGFQKHEALRMTEQKVFEDVLEQCITRKVDFVLVPGDLFHVNIPEMKVQKFAFAMFRRLYDAGIPVYAVYGSHDFSPVSNSVIDLLEAVGYITKVTRATSHEDGRISLDFVTDAGTGAKIAGLSGLKVGKDREWYDSLDRNSLESEPGFKIFMFHGGITEMKPDMDHADYMPLSMLPRGFAYYAGGHLHKFAHQEFADHAHVVYPGTPFAGYHTDLEENARGQERGFVVVEFDSKVRRVEFVPVPNTTYGMIEIDATDRKSESVNHELREKAGEINPSEKIIVIKIRGEMTAGKTADVDITEIRERFVGSGALAVNISKNQLSTKEYSISRSMGSSRDEVETNILMENIGQLRFTEERLLGAKGIDLAKRLLRELSRPQLANERKADYTSRIISDSLAVLGVGGD